MPLPQASRDNRDTAPNPAIRIAFGGAVVAIGLITLWLSLTTWGHAHPRWWELSLALMLALLGIQQLISSSLSLIWRRCLAAFLFVVAAANLFVAIR
jgi:hypothetical protein